MAIAPVSAYFLSLHYFFEGELPPVFHCLQAEKCHAGTNQNGAAITAAVTANIILFGYVIVALIEDQTSPSAPAPVQKEEKKTL